MNPYKLFLADPQATEAFGQQLAHCCSSGLVVFLRGHLGAGKTTLVRGFLRAMGHQGAVKSPTYTLIEPYTTPGGVVNHLDLYRLGDPDELEWMGMRDLLDGKQTCLIEWPEQGEGWLPPADVTIVLRSRQDGRQLEAVSASVRGEQLLHCLPPVPALQGGKMLEHNR